ncbi:hypothetical protein C9111_25065 [Escherichia coli]|nr:hypothetical protein [Escherichia coli]QSZ82510.1 hypothetical protein FS841_21675 [Escherichia coli]TJJ41203.1 hypothetical protein C9111_25065 [Escherichia coli]TJQ04401.1 hypothetical protein C9Z71_24475 [Escherichia coli]TJS61688.1 hypothetical protein C9Z14_21345 [Escherichia coli]
MPGNFSLRSHSSPRKNSHLTITTKQVMSGSHAHFLRMSGSQKTCFYIFHIVNLQRNRTWIPENFHK